MTVGVEVAWVWHHLVLAADLRAAQSPYKLLQVERVGQIIHAFYPFVGRCLATAKAAE